MADTAEQLADRRFARMRPFSGRRLPRNALRGLPPGPSWPALAQTVGLLRFRHRFVPAMHRRYGDVFTIRTLPHARPLVLFTRPEHAKEIFAGDPGVFHAGKGNAILGPVMGEHSLLLQDGAEHQRATAAADAGVQRAGPAQLRGAGHRGREGRGRALA